MIKKFLLLIAFICFSITFVQADIKKVAIVDVEKVVNSSAQVKALRKEQEQKRKEMALFIKKAGEDIKRQPDEAKREALAKKYDKELATKREVNAKTYKTKLEAVDKNISSTISQQAKTMGYDLVLTKGVVLYGGDDITDAVIKVVK